MVTTRAGSSTKARIAATSADPITRSRAGAEGPPTSVRPDDLERPRRRAQQGEHGEGEREACDREACREGEIEAREAELVDEVRDHVDLPSANELRRRE